MAAKWCNLPSAYCGLRTSTQTNRPLLRARYSDYNFMLASLSVADVACLESLAGEGFTTLLSLFNLLGSGWPFKASVDYLTFSRTAFRYRDKLSQNAVPAAGQHQLLL